jgi:predicted GNAT family N-acyltransferase
MDIHVVPVPWSSHSAQLRSVREIVFIQEQQVPQDLEWDGEDESAHHFLAINEAGQAIGCARLLASGQIGRMAVLAEFRGSGIGTRLLEVAVEQAKQMGLRRVYLHAQTHAEPFYRKGGFLPVGDAFMEAGIPHQSMELELPIPFESPGKIARPVLREETAVDTAEAVSELLTYRGVGDCAEGILQALRHPRRNLYVYSQTLDHALFDKPEIVDALSAFARSGPPVVLRLLIVDSSPITSRGHRLLELARRLDSKIEIRRVPDELADSDATFVTWDAEGFWVMPDHKTYAAHANHRDPVQANRLAERFNYLWERSSPDPELRLLRL